MFDSSGEITPPCGVPATVAETTPSSITPASSHCRSSLSTRRSEMRSRHELHQLLVVDAPEVVADVGVEHVMATLRAAASAGSPAPSSRSASAGSRTSTEESPPRRSAPARASPPSAPPGPVPSGSPAAASSRRPSGCTGAAPRSAGTSPARSSAPSSSRKRSTPCCSTSRDRLAIDARRAAVAPHPLPRFPEDVTPPEWSYSAWKRLPGARLAAAHSRRCSCRTLSRGLRPPGLLGPVVPAIPSRLPAPLDMTTPGTLPSRRVVLSRPSPVLRSPRTPAAQRSISPSAYTSRLAVTRRRRRVSRVPRFSLHACCAPYPAETRARAPDLAPPMLPSP